MRREATFVFADIAGFTALTEVHGDEAAAVLVERFAARVSAATATYDAELVKTVGDAVMLRVPEAWDAIAIALVVVHELMRDHGAPVVRAGMHSGPALERGGDWFGTTVNLAARIAGEAAGGEVLLSEQTRSAAGELPRVRYTARGVRRLRNVRAPLTLFAAIPAELDERQLVIDPVCRMALDPGRAVGQLAHASETFHFCSLACAGQFARDPAAYLRNGQAGASRAAPAS